MSHPIQERAFERQFFELIINLVILQPVAEDRLEAEDRCLHQAPVMIVALSLPLFPSDFSDRRKFSSLTWRSAIEFACRQIFAPLRGEMAALAPCRFSVS
jgi:hypothetical protein